MAFKVKINDPPGPGRMVVIFSSMVSKAQITKTRFNAALGLVVIGH